MCDHRSARHPLSSMLLLAALAAAVLFCNLADPLGLHQNDEDRFAGIARTMLARGEWLVPSYLGDTSFDKPPLLYWLMMASMRLLGSNLLAARLPVALCGLAMVLVTAGIARRRVPPAAAWLGGAVVATSFGFFQYGRAAMMDIPLALAMLISAAGFREAARGRTAGPYTALAAAALGTLLKGPVAVLLAVGAGLVWWLLSARARGGAPAVPAGHWLAAAVAGVAIAGAWPLALWGRGLGAEWFARFIVDENLGKFGGPSDSLLGMLRGFGALLIPWTFVLLGALWQIAREREWRDPDVMLPLTFLAVNLVVFSMPAVKWAHYMVPSVPMAGLLVAWAARGGTKPPLKIASTVSALVLLAAVPVLLMGTRLFRSDQEQALILLIAASLLCAAWFLYRARSLPRGALATGCALVAIALLAPLLTLNRLPANTAEVTQGHELLTFRLPPTQYANALGRRIASHDLPADFMRDFERGAMIIVGERDLTDLSHIGAVDLAQARYVLCWRNWKKALAPGTVLRGLIDGDQTAMSEDLCIVQKRQ